MDQREQQLLKAALVTTALYYRETFPDEVVKLYVADLADLPLEPVLAALHKYRRNPKARRAPIPADLRALIEGEDTAEGRGRDIAARLHGALVRHGYTWTDGYLSGGQKRFDGGGKSWPTWREAAIAELGGEDGVEVLTRLGGWTAFHQYANFSEPTTVAAQVRDLAASVARLPRRSGPALTSGGQALPGGAERTTPRDLVAGLARGMSVDESPCSDRA